jgi:hypothetical protein
VVFAGVFTQPGPKADIASILGLLAFDLTLSWVGLPFGQ